MKKTKKRDRSADRHALRSKYDFSGGVHGRTAARYREGTNVVLLDPDVAAVFPDSEAVNKALRAIVDAASASRSKRR